MKHVKHALEAAVIAALGYVPILAGSAAVRNFIGNHPEDAVYLPVAVGVLSAVYRWVKAKWGSAPAGVAAPAASK